jgi:outer membrane lipoprotein-sorting protein
VEIDRDALAYRLTLEKGATTQTIWLGTEDLRLLKSQTRGEPGYDIVFDDYQVVDQVLFPMQLSVTTVLADGTSAGTELSLHFKDAQLNVALDPALFGLEPPPGARRVELDTQGREIAAPTP